MVDSATGVLAGISATTRLAAYAGTVLARPLPPAIAEQASDHLLDTVASVVSGSELVAGLRGRSFVEKFGGRGDSLVLGSSVRTDPASAALANGMAAHADETDDSHERSRTHPGCSVVPAALAMAEYSGASGAELLRAVTFGYDMCTRITPALWPDFTELRAHNHSTHAIGGLFGSALAAATAGRIAAVDMPVVLSYTCHQASGTTMWMRDGEHVQKAYVFAGMPAFNGTRLALLVAEGWSGLREPFDGEPNFLEAFGKDSDLGLLVDDLGVRFGVEQTNIKWLTVGSPIQPAAQGLLDLLDGPELAGAQIASVEVVLPTSLAEVVTGRDMPAVNLEFVLSVILDDRAATFASLHDVPRFAVWRAAGGDRRISIAADAEMAPLRQAKVTVATTTGAVFACHVTKLRGSAEYPMTRAEVDRKAHDLIGPVLGAHRAEEIVETIRHLDGVDDVRTLTALLQR